MLQLTSPDFRHGGKIPVRFTCDGENLSPGLAWSGVPEGTRELLIACDDPDAPRGTFHHWLVYGLPPDAGGLEAGLRAPAPFAARVAVNDFGKPGYGGPCPPHGDRPHGYRFRLCALKGKLAPEAGAMRCAEVMKQAAPLVIESADLLGYYGRT